MGIIRLLLAISVVLRHTGEPFIRSLFGNLPSVQTFYIISGFYMSFVLNEKYIGQNKSYRLFLFNRLARLFPIYWTVLILVIGYSAFGFFYTHGQSPGRLLPYVQHYHHLGTGSFIFLIFTNVFVFLQDLVMFLGIDITTGNLFFTSRLADPSSALHRFLFIPQAWTIGVEISFYLVAPFILRKSLNVIIPLLMASFLLRALLYSNGLDHDPWTYRFFPCELGFFLMGNLSYRILKKTESIKAGIRYYTLAFMFMLLFIVFYRNLTFLSGFQKPLYFTAFVISLPFIFQQTKKWKLDNFICRLSYPVYISHLFIHMLVARLQIEFIGGTGVTVTVCSILFSIVLNELITKRVERYRLGRTKKAEQNTEGLTVLKADVA